MSTWRKRFSKKSRQYNETHETFLNNTIKYRKKLQTTIAQINRTKQFVQRNLDHSDSEIILAHLINDIGQTSDNKSLQEMTSLIDSLAMRYQLSTRIFNEYSMNALKKSLENLNNNLCKDFDRSKSVFEEAVNNHCSNQTNKQLFNKMEAEWSKHKKLAIGEFKHGLSSYCDIGLYHLKIQTTILENLQSFIHQLPSDENENQPDLAAQSQQTRKDIDTMLRVMLDSAPNDPSLLPNPKRPRFLTTQITLSNSLHSAEIIEAAARPAHESTIVTPQNDQLTNNESLPSYTDLFVVPSSCKQTRNQRRSPRFHNPN